MADGTSNSDGPSNELNGSETTTRDDFSLASSPRTLFAEIFVSHDRLVLVPTIKSTTELSIQVDGDTDGRQLTLFRFRSRE